MSCPAGNVQVNDELSRFLSVSGLRIRDERRRVHRKVSFRALNLSGTMTRGPMRVLGHQAGRIFARHPRAARATIFALSIGAWIAVALSSAHISARQAQPAPAGSTASSASQ